MGEDLRCLLVRRLLRLPSIFTDVDEKRLRPHHQYEQRQWLLGILGSKCSAYRLRRRKVCSEGVLGGADK